LAGWYIGRRRKAAGNEAASKLQTRTLALQHHIHFYIVGGKISAENQAAMSTSESDLRHAISMRPHPFQSQSNIHTHHHSARDQSPALRAESVAPPPTSPDYIGNQDAANRRGHSTSYQATTPNDEENDAFARHVADRSNDQDVEAQPERQYSPESDPYELSSKLKAPWEIDLIKANTSRKRQDKSEADRKCSLPLFAAGKDKWQARKLQGFYESQNENIERLLKPVDDHRRDAKDMEGATALKYKIAVNASFVANLVLAGLQLYAAISSKSLSLITTMADALFDPLSNVTLMLTNRAAKRVDPRRYPSGKARIETAGNIFFCFLMCAVSMIIIVESIQELAGGSKSPTKEFFKVSVIAVGIAFITKLVLFMYCFALRNIYSQIRILWEDHRNDLIINGFGIMFSVMGSFIRWWIDPLGAIILSAIVIFLWMRTAVSEFKLLIGVSAETHMLQLITYICKRHPFLTFCA